MFPSGEREVGRKKAKTNITAANKSFQQGCFKKSKNILLKYYLPFWIKY